MLLVLFKVLFKGILDVFSLGNLFVDDVEYVLENKVDLSNRGLLDEVFDNFDLQLAHIDLAETITIISFYSYNLKGFWGFGVLGFWECGNL